MRQPTGRKLTPAESDAMRERLIGFVAKEPPARRAHKLARVMGCSERTARRVLTRTHGVAMRRAYATHASMTLGIPVSVFCKPTLTFSPVTYLPTWEGLMCADSANREAMNLLTLVSNMLRVTKGLATSHALYNDFNGYPHALTIQVMLLDRPPATLRFSVSSRRDRMRLNYTDSKGICQFSAVPNLKTVETIIKHIQ